MGELFLIPVEDQKYLLYAPLRRAAAVINRRAAAIIGRYLENDRAGFDAPEQVLIAQLIEAGLIGGEEPAPPAFPADYQFAPYEVTLFLTTRCNLRCRYCYAEGGVRQQDLTWNEAKAAIDFVAENALGSGRQNFIVGFHGGGEPTLAWEMLTRSVTYAEQLASQHNLHVNIHTATNGVLSAAQRQYILEHFSGVNVSFDGPQDIQDFNRPFANGRGSFEPVMETLRFFDRAAAEREGFEYGVRATVTNQSVGRIAEIVDFLGTNLPGLNRLHIEPLWYCGRCHTSGETPPEPEEFSANFITGLKVAKDLGLTLTYSGARLDTLSNRFCAAPGEGFAVIPGGIVTSCFEVCDADDPRSEIFHYGHFDTQSERYVFDHQKILRQRGLSVENLSFCADCFCKWHCAGDCLSKALQTFGPDGHQGSLRCAINRELTLFQIWELIQSE